MTLTNRMDALSSRYLNAAAIERDGLPFSTVLLFGAGQRGRLIRRYFAKRGAATRCFIDNNPELAGTTVDDLLVWPLKEAIARYPDTPIYIASSHFQAIAAQLQALGLTTTYCMPLTSFYFYPFFYEENEKSLNTVYDMLADDESKLCYAAIVKTYQTGDEGHLRLSRYAQYRHPFVTFQDGDSIIDGGAFNGDTVTLIHQSVCPDTVLSLEPTDAMYAELTQKCAQYGKQYRCEKVGLWSKTTDISFSTTGDSPSGNKIAAHGTSTIHCTTIDALVSQHGLPRVDLIKLDIEGAEEKALEGARQTIQTFKPKLQISIYHTINDLFSLPLRIKQLNPSYTMYVGHHAPDVHETILYCTE